MSKVICDICGTAYPETSSHCPICGSAKSSPDQTAAADPTPAKTAAEPASSYAYVKGGRFSKKNVRKRNNNKNMPERRESGRRDREEKDDKANVGLVIVVILLLIAIIGMIIYIGIRFFATGKPDDPAGTGTTQDSGTIDSTGGTDATDGDISCEDLTLSSQTIEFTASGEVFTLLVELNPADTTQKVVYESSNKEVAIVSENGAVMAVGHGEAIITVYCGSVKKECRVVCSFGGTDATDPSTPDAEEFVFKFNTKYVDDYTGKQDITFATKTTWKAYTNELTVDPADITWVSDNPEVCTIDKGIVTIVGPGTTQVHAQYQGKTFSCFVRSKVKVEVEEDNTTDTPDTPDTPAASYTISHDDVTIAVGEKFNLRLKDSNGNAVEVSWKAEKADYVTIDGNKITGAAVGTTNVSAEHEGKTYTCVVRVKNAT